MRATGHLLRQFFLNSCSIHSVTSPLNMAGIFGNRTIINEELRMVMVGKTGNGKSATGNTILGRQCFESKFAAASVTKECSKGRGTVDGQKVAVVDTPGLFDTRYDEEKIEKGIRQCVMYAAPGPHVFLVVIRLGRFTEEEKKTVEKIQEMFGQAADQYSMVLFTHGDLLNSNVEEFLEGSRDLQELVARCNGHYHVFNNKSRDRSQVTELLQKIRNMVQKNGGSHYTNETFQEAERILEEEKQQILKEKEEEIRREKENLERTLKQQFDREIAALKEQLAAEMKTLEELRFKEDQQQRVSMMQKMQAEHAQALRDQQTKYKQTLTVQFGRNVQAVREGEKMYEEMLRGAQNKHNQALIKQHKKIEEKMRQQEIRFEKELKKKQTKLDKKYTKDAREKAEIDKVQKICLVM